MYHDNPGQTKFYFSKEAKKIRSNKIKNKIRLKRERERRIRLDYGFEFMVRIKDKQINGYYLLSISQFPFTSPLVEKLSQPSNPRVLIISDAWCSWCTIEVERWEDILYVILFFWSYSFPLVIESCEKWS